ncbi:hypothetical protein PAPYR_9673 [Paratrimastix pyriformis]|uniref:Uncharacterized protein n=1 Tax=Paratrimastix pyriformis TaxID=342808 RepID=A0ABQ8UDG7_9EUKA|nr:hypothetical protein PAPYR_9673 [Paratrimastix pyriformis]
MHPFDGPVPFVTAASRLEAQPNSCTFPEAVEIINKIISPSKVDRIVYTWTGKQYQIRSEAEFNYWKAFALEEADNDWEIVCFLGRMSPHAFCSDFEAEEVEKSRRETGGEYLPDSDPVDDDH